MARVKIQEPEHYSFSNEIQIRVTDLNYGNHLGNDALLGIIHEARVQWLQALKQNEKVFFGTGLIMADSAIVYKSEGFLGNVLTCKVGVTEIGKFNFDVVYNIFNNTTNKLLAIAKTGMVCFDYQTSKVALLPDEAKAAF